MWAENIGRRLAVGAAQFFDYARARGWRGRLALRAGRLPENKQAGPAKVIAVSDLAELYLRSSSFQALSPSTKKTYSIYLGRIRERFGTTPLSVLEERGSRALIRQWRDQELSSQPRTADSMIAVLRRLINFGLDEEYLNRNPAANLGRLHTKTRRDIIWSDAQIATFLKKAPRHLARALLLAIWTGQRQGDLLALRWDCYDGTFIRLQQKKVARGSSGRRVKILVSGELKRLLAEIKAEQLARSNSATCQVMSDFILTNSTGKPWRGGFKCAWRNAVAKAGITGVTFHDLRGTFITLSHRAGATIREIAEASGHDEFECERVIRENYLAPGAHLVISKLEASKRFAGPDWLKQIEPVPTRGKDNERFTGPRRARAPKSNAPPSFRQESSY